MNYNLLLIKVAANYYIVLKNGFLLNNVWGVLSDVSKCMLVSDFDLYNFRLFKHILYLYKCEERWGVLRSKKFVLSNTQWYEWGKQEIQ